MHGRPGTGVMAAATQVTELRSVATLAACGAKHMYSTRTVQPQRMECAASAWRVQSVSAGRMGNMHTHSSFSPHQAHVRMMPTTSWTSHSRLVATSASRHGGGSSSRRSSSSASGRGGSANRTGESNRSSSSSSGTGTGRSTEGRQDRPHDSSRGRDRKMPQLVGEP